MFKKSKKPVKSPHHAAEPLSYRAKLSFYYYFCHNENQSSKIHKKNVPAIHLEFAK